MIKKMNKKIINKKNKSNDNNNNDYFISNKLLNIYIHSFLFMCVSFVYFLDGIIKLNFEEVQRSFSITNFVF